MAKRPVPLYDFKAFGAAIKAARNEYGESRKKVSDELYISPRYLANIENKGQQPSLQVFYDLVTRYHISVDQFFFPNSNAEKSTGRRQLDALLDGMSDKGIRIVHRNSKGDNGSRKSRGLLQYALCRFRVCKPHGTRAFARLFVHAGVRFPRPFAGAIGTLFENAKLIFPPGAVETASAAIFIISGTTGLIAVKSRLLLHEQFKRPLLALCEIHSGCTSFPAGIKKRRYFLPQRG